MFEKKGRGGKKGEKILKLFPFFNLQGERENEE